MSMFGLFGSDSKSQSTSTTLNKPADQRIGVEGGMSGLLIGPDATTATGGGMATRTGDYSPLTITGNKFKVGMTGADVTALLKEQSLGFATAASAAAETNAKMASLATTALGAQTTGLPIDFGKLVVPVAVIIGIVLIARRRK